MLALSIFHGNLCRKISIHALPGTFSRINRRYEIQIPVSPSTLSEASNGVKLSFLRARSLWSYSTSISLSSETLALQVSTLSKKRSSTSGFHFRAGNMYSRNSSNHSRSKEHRPDLIAYVKTKRARMNWDSRPPPIRLPHQEHLESLVFRSVEALQEYRDAYSDDSFVIFDPQGVSAYITDQSLWEEGLKTYGCTVIDVLRWRNALASSNLTDAIPHLISVMTADDRMMYEQQDWIPPPPIWVLHHLFRNHIKTPGDVSLALRVLVSMWPFLFPSDRWKLALLVLRQACNKNLAPLLHDCITVIFEVYPTQEHDASSGSSSSGSLLTSRKLSRVLEAVMFTSPTQTSSDEVLRVLKKHEEAGFPVDAALMHSFDCNSQPLTTDIAEHLLRRMKAQGWDIPPSILHRAMEATAKAGDVDGSAYHFRSLLRSVSSPASEDHFWKPPSRRQLSPYIATYLSSMKDPADLDALRIIDDLMAASGPWSAYSPVMSAAFDVLSRKKSISPHRLSGVHEGGLPLSTDSLVIFQKNVSAFTSVMARLINRGHAGIALKLWDALRFSSMRFDEYVLAVVVRALGEVGRFRDAFALICKVSGRDLPAEAIDSLDVPIPGDGMRVQFTMDDVYINTLMMALNRGRRPDVVWQIWNCMEAHFDIKPTAATMSTLIAAADYSDVFPSFSSEFLEFSRHLPFLRSKKKRIAKTVTPDAILEALAPDHKPGLFWDSLPPWRTAQLIFLEILFENFPHLRSVVPPVSGKKNSYELFPQSNQSLKGRTTGTDSSSHDFLDKFSHLYLPEHIPPEPRWPHIYPDVYTFDAYLCMMCRYSMAHEVPLVFAWMRALGVKPQKKSLTWILAAYMDVGIPPPMIDHFIDQQGGDYAKLRSWLEDWLGQDNVPKQIYVDKMKTWIIHEGWKNGRSEPQPWRDVQNSR